MSSEYHQGRCSSPPTSSCRLLALQAIDKAGETPAAPGHMTQTIAQTLLSCGTRHNNTNNLGISQQTPKEGIDTTQ